MSQPVLIKVYGNLTPAEADLAEVINRLCGSGCPAPETPACSLAGNLLTISFEGVYFPTEEVVAAIKRQLYDDQQGKLDELDLENWRLTRYIFAGGEIRRSSAPLNNVLDYSGIYA